MSLPKDSFSHSCFPRENVKLIGVRHESMTFGGIGRCEHTFFTLHSHPGGSDRDVLILAVSPCTVLAAAEHSIPMEKMCATVGRTDM